MKRPLLPYVVAVAALAVAPAVSLAQYAAAPDARDLAALTAEVAQLTAQSQQLEGEAATLGPRRHALEGDMRRARRRVYTTTLLRRVRGALGEDEKGEERGEERRA